MTHNDETLVDFNGLTAQVTAAYVANNNVHVSDLASIITAVHTAFSQSASSTAEPAPVLLKPAVPIKKSVTDDFIICLEDGKLFKSLKRHLSSHYGLSPNEYREKWGLPDDYPMVAPAYAAKRSQLAKKLGLGHKRNRVFGELPPAPASAKRGRKRTLPDV